MNSVGQFLKQWWFLIVFGLSLVSGGVAYAIRFERQEVMVRDHVAFQHVAPRALEERLRSIDENLDRIEETQQNIVWWLMGSHPAQQEKKGDD